MATHTNTARRPRRQRPHLTDAVVRHLDPSKPRIVYDGDLAGFGIRLSPASRCWVLNFSLNRRERRLTIGAWPTWPAKLARARALELRREIDQGIDPMQQRQEERAAPTMDELLDLYLEHAKAKRSFADDRANIAAYIKPRWQHRKAAAITSDDVEALHLELTKAGKPVRANRCLALLSTIFALAIKRKTRADNPCRGIGRNKETHRERYLTIDEVGRLVEVLGSWPDTRSAVAVKLLLLLGCRRGELLRAHWREFDLVGRTWVKPAANTKTGKRRCRPDTATCTTTCCAPRSTARAAMNANGAQVVTNGPQANPYDSSGSWSTRQNVRDSQRYEAVVHSNRGYRASRVGVFLCRRADVDYFFQCNAADFAANPLGMPVPGTYLDFPTAWQHFIGEIPPEDRGDVVQGAREGICDAAAKRRGPGTPVESGVGLRGLGKQHQPPEPR
jgi:integrase